MYIDCEDALGSSCQEYVKNGGGDYVKKPCETLSWVQMGCKKSCGYCGTINYVLILNFSIFTVIIKHIYPNMVFAIFII